MIDELERLAALHERGALTDFEFEQQKRDLLQGARVLTIQPNFTGHAVACLVGALIMLFLCFGLSEMPIVTRSDLQTSQGLGILASIWLIPHSVWVLMQRGSVGGTKIVPLAALLAVGLSWAFLLTTEITTAKGMIRAVASEFKQQMDDLSGK